MITVWEKRLGITAVVGPVCVFLCACVCANMLLASALRGVEVRRSGPEVGVKHRQGNTINACGLVVDVSATESSSKTPFER